MRLALYQPDIAANTGAMLRLAACMGVYVDVIEPAGFPWSDRTLRRAGMDYLDHVEVVRHACFADFEAVTRAARRRIVLLTTAGDIDYTDFAFAGRDVLMVGRETAGVPDTVHGIADARVVIPMRAGLRSLNVAMAAAMVLGEALRQTAGAPGRGNVE